MIFGSDPRKMNTRREPLVSSAEMKTLHDAGMAKAFEVIGTVRLQISWTKGQTLGTGAIYKILN
jgi:hypothetical protein